MKRNLFAISLSVMLVVALIFVVAPGVKAEEGNVIIAEANGEYSITESGKILDLNGQKNIKVDIAEGIELAVIDSANMELDASTAGTLTKTGAGTIAPVTLSGDYRYLAVVENGTYSFHPFNLTISAIGINTISEDICIRVSFVANNIVKDKLGDYGVEKLTGEDAGEFPANERYSFDGKNIVHAYYDLEGSLASEEKLDITNQIRAYMVIDGKKVVSNYAPEITPRQVLKKINQDGLTPSDTQKAAIENLIAKSSYLKNLFTSITGATCEHQGGTATCTAQAVCIDCDASYGDMLDHSYTTYVSTKAAGTGNQYGYDTYKCACGATEKVNWTRHISDKALTAKEQAALAALTPEAWNGNGNLNGAGQWFYKAAGVDISSVLTKTVYSTMTTLFTSGSSETKLWPIAGNTTDYAKMLITNYYGGSAAYKHAQFVAADFQIGDLFCAKGICATCKNAHYMVALYQGEGRFLAVSNCGGGSDCKASCKYDETTIFAEDFFAQKDVANWNYYFVLRPNMLTQIRDLAETPLTDAEKEAISGISATDISSEYNNLNGFANEVYKLAGIDAAAYLNKSSWNAHTSAFAAESSNWTKMLLPESWGGTSHTDAYVLDGFAFEIGDILSGKRKASGSDYWTAIYQGDGQFLVHSSYLKTVKTMTLAEIFAAENTWEYYFVLRPNQLASAE